MKDYDIIIIGGGPAGLTAGIYASRARMKTFLIEKLSLGGQAALTEIIENYPGFPQGIPGPELMRKMKEQAIKIGLEIISEEVIEIEVKKRVVKTKDREYKASAIIVASGTVGDSLAQ
ncbi:MAG TPA: FAD-binding protein [bacterium]|nr:FAD-binding protein [bacterium]